MMTVSDSLPKPRLKIKFSCKTTQLVLKTGSSCEASKQLWINENCVSNCVSVSLNGNKDSMRKQESRKAAPHSSHSLNGVDGSPMRRSSVKRGPSGVIDTVLNKRQKMMDPSLKRYCGLILEALIKHPTSCGFCEPVDPVKLNIPDYFIVISKPMDLGTVRTKLQNNIYLTVVEFKDDVKLTFSNAMRYNPSGNLFHKNAMTLDSIFNTKWKSLELKLKREGLISGQESCPLTSSFRELQKTTETTRHLCPRESSPLTVGLAPMMSMSFQEKKRKLTKDPGEAMPEKVTDYVKISNARPANEEAAARKIRQNSRCPGKVVLRKGTVSGNRRSTCGGSVKTIASSFNVVATRCGSCGSLKCECCHQKKGGYYAYESSSNNLALPLPCERYTGGQNCVASKMEHESSLTSNNTCKSDPESDVAVSALDEENNCSSPQPSSGTPDMSPNKALRAAMLKKRFADTILKAKQKQKSLLDPINLRLRQEKEELERQQQEEKARIEDQIRAAKVASSFKAQAQGELRLSREREREAARIALEKMEKTVEIEDNIKVLKELEIILFKARQGDRFGNMMERIGLFLKNDYMDYQDEEDGLFLQDWEEGQICSC